jgi:hypothetical protein
MVDFVQLTRIATSSRVRTGLGDLLRHPSGRKIGPVAWADYRPFYLARPGDLCRARELVLNSVNRHGRAEFVTRWAYYLAV